MKVLLLLALVLLVPGCRREQELLDDCPSAGGACPACTVDTECIIMTNPCQETAQCTSVDRQPPLRVTLEGCPWPLDVPPAARCGCVAGVCRSR